MGVDPPAEISAQLLLDLAQALHASALPADIVEERLRAAAAGLGIDAQFFTMQSFVAANEQALDSTIATWKSSLDANIDTAVDKWFDDARASVLLASK